MPGFPSRPLTDYIDASGVCWEWTGARSSTGYGNRHVPGSGKPGHNVTAHRAVWEWLVGPIPEGLQLDHLCRNRGCVNPDHLEPVTNRENSLRGSSPHWMRHYNLNVRVYR